MFLILEAAKMHGKKSMEKRQELLLTTIDTIKQDMFNKAKMNVLKKVNNLKVLISHSSRQACFKTCIQLLKLNLLLFICAAVHKGCS